MSAWASFKSLTAGLLLRNGLEIRQAIPRRGTLEGDLQAVLRHCQVQTVLDVGANAGQFGLLLRERLAFSGRIISFEPSPRPFSMLTQCNDNAWLRLPIALGDRAGEFQLRNYQVDQLDSLHGPSQWGSANWNMEGVGVTNVEVHRLDSLLKELKIEPIETFLKVDTQGHDLAVLRGAGSSISRYAGLLMEMATTNLYEDAPTFGESLSFVRDHGYEAVGFYPVQRRNDGLAAIEFDGLFVRSSR